jgi:iron complex transport system permease protein
LAALVMFWEPDNLRAMQAFLLGTTGFLGWSSVVLLGVVLVASLMAGIGFSRALDALALGEATAASLGVPLAPVRIALIGAMHWPQAPRWRRSA